MAQVFGLIGIVAGVATAAWLSRWVGDQWHGARPAALFWALRWVIAVIGGMAVIAIAGWIGERLRARLHPGPVGWLDRALGIPVGAGVGLATMATMLLLALQTPLPHGIAASVARTRVAPPLMAGAARTCSLGGEVVPGSHWLGRHFEAAVRRTRDRAGHGEAAARPRSS